MKTYNIASIAGDGIGTEVVPVAHKVLKKISEQHQFKLVIDEFDFASCDYYEKHGKMMPDNWKEKIEKHDAIERLSPKPEITRFKGLGEISPNEFKNFIGENMRLDPIIINKDTSIEKLLSFYMGKNTPDRQQFIIDNLKVELDIVESKEDKNE